VRVYSARQVLAGLAGAGFEQVSRRGSHIKLRAANGRTVIVPDHREIARGTMRSILRQAGLTAEEFEALTD
jgi:predicted RNA binding protein YcfA (HicA-like mRNA interferase family)